ncbi:MAG: UbiD family decarboxylase [Deltaproteobacteria bacterium]|nr:UbiD family decarboxylase [Deltaproteobacteria bacterium]
MNTTSLKSSVDMNKFRLRSFVDKLIKLDEIEIHEAPVPLSDISRILEATSKAVFFKNTGPEQVELVGNVMGKRSRLAAAFNTTEKDLVKEFQARLDSHQPVIEINSEEAPVHEIILKGEDADLTRLPFHPQHRFDGGTYLSAGIDYTIDPDTGRTNVGCRRLSLRNRHEAGTNVTAPSDLKSIYQACLKRGEKLHVNFAVGSHPIDFMAAGMRVPADEVTLISSLRGEPVPMVKGVTNEVRVPADTEIIIEGFLDERGYCEPEGPYGEYMGYYGPMHMDPVYHVTAITMRSDALYQTVLHGCGRILHRAESANLMSLVLESRVRTILKTIAVEPIDACAKLSSGEGQNLRVSIRKTKPGQARRVISSLFEALPILKHIFVVDEDIDVSSEEQFEWALATRFQADKDLMIFSGMRGLPMDPSLEGQPVGSKAGFDMTIPFNSKGKFLWLPCAAPEIGSSAQYKTVRQALESRPMFFVDIMDSVGSNDGREVSLELDELRNSGQLTRLQNGEYALQD